MLLVLINQVITFGGPTLQEASKICGIGKMFHESSSAHDMGISGISQNSPAVNPKDVDGLFSRTLC